MAYGDTISRQVAIDALEEGFKDATEGVDKLSPTYGLIKAVTGIYKCLIGKLPSAQPEPCDDEWCTDCKEYDKEKHCCPRWNRVIRQTLADAQPQRTGKWIPKDGRYHCDQCSGIAPKGIRWDFCPNCGAKMTKGDAE